MKKIFLCIILLAYSINVHCQQTAVIDLVARSLPTGTVKLTKEQLISFANQQSFDADVIQSKPEHIYQYGNILIALFDFKKQKPDNYIQESKASSDRTWSKHQEYTSVLKSFNNYQVFISSYENRGITTFMFTSINNQKSQLINGIIQCKKEDIVKARQLVNNIVEHIPFDN